MAPSRLDSFGAYCLPCLLLRQVAEQLRDHAVGTDALRLPLEVEQQPMAQRCRGDGFHVIEGNVIAPF